MAKGGCGRIAASGLLPCIVVGCGVAAFVVSFNQL
jgi:hypothetical protein